jgi:hypothetical protein
LQEDFPKRYKILEIFRAEEFPLIARCDVSVQSWWFQSALLLRTRVKIQKDVSAPSFLHAAVQYDVCGLAPSALHYRLTFLATSILRNFTLF